MVIDRGRQYTVSQGNVVCILSSDMVAMELMYLAFGFHAITDIPVELWELCT